jgi:hypothetical protein
MSSWSLTLGDEGEAAWPGICQAVAEAKDAREAARIEGRRTRLAQGRRPRSQAVSRRDASPRASSAAAAASFATSVSPSVASASVASASVASPTAKRELVKEAPVKGRRESSESRKVAIEIEHAHPTPPIIEFHDLTLVRPAVHGPPLPPRPRQQRVLVDRIYRCPDQTDCLFTPTALQAAKFDKKRRSAKEEAALEKKVAARIEEYEDLFDEDMHEVHQYGGSLYEREEHIASLKVALAYADKHHPDLDRAVLKKILLRKVPSSVIHPELVEEIQEFLEEIFPYPDTFARTNLRPAAAEIIHNTLEGDDPDYLAFVNTPRKLYCIRCKLYACNLHQEDGDTLRKGSLQLQYEIAMETEKLRGKPVLETRQYDALEIPARSELEPWQKAICRRVFLIYEGDLDKVALVVNAPRSLIEDFCRDFKVPSERVLVKNPPKDKHPYQSIKNYPHNLYKAIREKGMRAYCQPCAHDRPCEEKDSGCSCVKNKVSQFYSQPHEDRRCIFRLTDTALIDILWQRVCMGSLESEFLPRLQLQGRLRKPTVYMPCQSTVRNFKDPQCPTHIVALPLTFYIHRECDPKLCGCDTCTDPPGQLITKQRCCNDSKSTIINPRFPMCRMSYLC